MPDRYIRLHVDPDNPPIDTIRKLLTAAFTAQSLNSFCLVRPEFRPARDQFAPGDGLAAMVSKLIVYCSTELLWDELLVEVAREVPRQYARFEPQLRAQAVPVVSEPEPVVVRPTLPESPPPSDRLSNEEKDKLVGIIANQADNAPFVLGAKGYLIGLIDRTNWPEHWQRARRADVTGVPDFDARRLADWAIDQGKNPVDTRYTVLGGLLDVLHDDVGLEDRRWIVALSIAHGLYKDEFLSDQISMRYQVPLRASALEDEAVEFGPDIDWQGAADQDQLQRLGRAESKIYDVGFLMRAIKRAASVCRIEIPVGSAEGTGFLIAPTLVLTNYHVLAHRAIQDMEQRARDTVLRFGNITAADGTEAEGELFRLDGRHPILASSPVDELDYVLLRVEDRIQQAEGIEPAPFTLGMPFEGMDLHILQHPLGQALKLAMSECGVEKVIENKGLVQYFTAAKGGSSGSPCFTDSWEVAALHHAQRAKWFGTIREGIIFQSIHGEIEDLLPN